MRASSPLTVLLTGASGDVGREIHRVLKAKGVNVVPVSSKDREGWVKWDLKNPAPSNAPKKVDTVVSCVGHRPKHLLEYAKKSAKHVVHIGSIATEQKGKHDAYSGGKAKEEEAFQAFSKANNIPLSVVCPAIVCDKGNKWEAKFKKGKPLALATAPFFRLGLVRGKMVGEAVHKALLRPGQRIVVTEQRKTFGDIYGYDLFFVFVAMVSIATALAWDRPAGRAIGLTVLGIVLLFNVALLVAAASFRSANMLVS